MISVLSTLNIYARGERERRKRSKIVNTES